jgi:K+-transporting ATPase KdpF subunit
VRCRGERSRDPADCDRVGCRLCRLPVALRPGALMNVIELVTAVATVFVFIYLIWALLRPEDF